MFCIQEHFGLDVKDRTYEGLRARKITIELGRNIILFVSRTATLKSNLV